MVGKYEKGTAAVWSEGDWNGDGGFTSSDFVAAFVDGGYEKGERGSIAAAVPEPSSCILLIGGALLALWSRRNP